MGLPVLGPVNLPFNLDHSTRAIDKASPHSEMPNAMPAHIGHGACAKAYGTAVDGHGLVHNLQLQRLLH
ncbi:hypothetical protein J1614_000997 [Plenodomus biglobosus]|nr:hypothetical protein J1614_000997 [Plenodomus biglobosus]